MCNFTIYFDIQAYYLDIPSILLGYPSSIHTFMPTIGSWCVIINFSTIHVIWTPLLKIDISGHFKAYSSLSFKPTGIGIAHMGKPRSTSKFEHFFLQIYKAVYFAKKKTPAFQQIPENLLFSFFLKLIIWNTYIFTKCVNYFKFSISLKSYGE